MPARFDHTNGSLVFARAPSYGQGGVDVFQTEARSAGGDPYGFDPVAVERPLPLSFPRMPLADWEALLAFFDLVDGMAEEFTYTDVGGVAHAVRFAVPEIEAEEVAFATVAVTVPLIEI